MNEETNMVTEQTPNRIEGSDLERKTGGADMETAATAAEQGKPGLTMEQSWQTC